MNRLASAGCAVAAGCCSCPERRSAAPDARSLPMHSRSGPKGPSEACGDKCRTWVSASGAITADTPRDFEAFAKSRKIEGMTIALDSDGGSVLGALALGRSIRKLGMITTVGRTIDLRHAKRPQAREASAARLLRIDVRLRAARRHRAAGARRGAGDGAPDLARRPPRRSDRGELLGRGPCGGSARHRPARAIHRGDGRRHRPARDRAQDFRRGSRCGSFRATNCAS